MNKLSPNLMVTDVTETAKYYINNLGFKLVMAVTESDKAILNELPVDKQVDYAAIIRGNAQIMLQDVKSFRHDLPVFNETPIGASICLYCEMENIDGFYNEIKDKVDIVRDLDTAWYGMREVFIRDINGYVLGFAEEVQG